MGIENNKKVEETTAPSPEKVSFKDWLYPLIFALLISCSSVAGTQIIKKVYNGKFNAILFTTTFTISFEIFVFPIYYCFNLCFRKIKVKRSEFLREILAMYDEPFAAFHYPILNSPAIFYRILRYSLTMTFFTVFFVGTNYMYIKALEFLDPSVNSGIFSSCNGIIFILSILILRDHFYTVKAVSVALAISGIVLMVGVQNATKKQISGIILSFSASISVSIYKVMYKFLIKKGSLQRFTFFLSSVGLFNIIYGIPLVYILHVAQLEVLPPLDQIPWAFIFGKTFTSLLSDFLIAFGIAVTSPLAITIGALLSYPLNIIIDVFYGSRKYSYLNWIGISMILISFVLILIPEDILKVSENRIRSCYKKLPLSTSNETAPNALENQNQPLNTSDSVDPVLPLTKI